MKRPTSSIWTTWIWRKCSVSTVIDCFHVDASRCASRVDWERQRRIAGRKWYRHRRTSIMCLVSIIIGAWSLDFTFHFNFDPFSLHPNLDMGPGIQQKFVDLPTTIETADDVQTRSNQARPPQRPNTLPPQSSLRKSLSNIRPKETPPSLPHSPSPLGSMSSLAESIMKVADQQSQSSHMRHSSSSSNSLSGAESWLIRTSKKLSPFKMKK